MRPCRLIAALLVLICLALGAPAQAAVPVPWGLDRIDQRALPLDGSYRTRSTGSGVTVYVVDTGIRLTSHDLHGRAVTGVDVIDGGEANDCNGHGTHVAGLIAGSRYGVAKAARLVAVRVMDCQGRGSESTIRKGLSWVLSHHRAGQPAVLNMSLGGAPSVDVDKLVKALVKDGVVVVVAAGNGDPWGNAADACDFSPARTKLAITVSATDQNDAKPRWANTGSCVDLFAPGVNVPSDWDDSDVSEKTISGTSMAAPAVTGAAALYLSTHPSAKPSAVRAALVKAATRGVVKGHGSAPDRLLHVT
ncbi:MAG: putative subtilase-family protease [Frankiales bacterium]|nr:putative subtilase-family protease [Frankiales bacterium]